MSISIGGSYVLKKSDVDAFFAAIGREMRLVAPKKQFGGDETFDVVESPDQIAWDYSHTIVPPKHFLFPQSDDMFNYKADGAVEYKRLVEAPKQAIVGIRSCDVKAIRFQQRFFTDQIVDPYFKARLDNTVLFSLVCNEPPREECFCICCDAGPYLESDFDVQLTDLGDRFLYEIGSENGLNATQLGAQFLSEAGQTEASERKRIELEADSKFTTVGYLAKAIMFISSDEVPAQVWEELGSTCMRCGACTNLCPVCTCYTVDDRPESDGSYTRCRSWDSCQFAGFTREGSGHNPRPTPGTRVQRRFYHKASYQYIMRDGKHGCVGCGRCVSTCMTHLGVPDVVKRIRRAMADYLQPEEKTAEV